MKLKDDIQDKWDSGWTIHDIADPVSYTHLTLPTT